MRSLPSRSFDLAPVSAFMSDDSIRILRFALECLEEGFGAALVTLVEITGGAARSLGSQMAVRSDGLHCGYVSGGCTEAAVAVEAAEAIASGVDRYFRIGEGSRFFDIVLPCGGAITLYIHVLREGQPLRSVIEHLEARRRTGLRYDPSTQSLRIAAFRDVGWSEDCFFSAYRPQTRVLIGGQSIELHMAANLAAAAGYDLLLASTAAEARRISAEQIDEDAAVVLLHHDLDRELPVLQLALAARPFYIGCLGSTRTHKRRSDALRDLGYGEADIARIKAPIGIFGKARDAASLALSVLADVAAARNRPAA